MRVDWWLTLQTIIYDAREHIQCEVLERKIMHVMTIQRLDLTNPFWTCSVECGDNCDFVIQDIILRHEGVLQTYLFINSVRNLFWVSRRNRILKALQKSWQQPETIAFNGINAWSEHSVKNNR